MNVEYGAGRPAGRGVPPVEVAPAVAVDVDAAVPKDRVRWGPIVAGVVTGFVALLVLTALGLALGVSTLGGESAATWGTAAGIWGGLSLLLAFFLGGWVAGHAAVTLREGDGPLNGFLAGAAAPAAIQAVNTGVVPEQNVQEAATAVAGVAENPQAAVPPQAEQAAREAAQTARQAAGPGAWGTLIAMLLALVAATLGGIAGHQERVGRTRQVVARTYGLHG